MRIDTVFINEKENLKKKVAEIPVEKCIENYFEYLDLNADGIEGKYIKRLNDRAKNFIFKLESRLLKNKTVEEMKTIYMEALWDGVYGLSEKPWNEVADDYTYTYSNKDLYEDIKKEMSDALEELFEEINTSEKEKRLIEIKNDLKHKNDLLDNIENEFNNRKIQLANDINRLEQTLEAIQ